MQDIDCFFSRLLSAFQWKLVGLHWPYEATCPRRNQYLSRVVLRRHFNYTTDSAFCSQDSVQMEETMVADEMRHCPAPELFDFIVGRLVDFSSAIGR